MEHGQTIRITQIWYYSGNLKRYADDINTLTSHHNIETAERNVQPYLNELYKWTTKYYLQLNPDKSSSILLAPDHAEIIQN